MSGQNVVGAYGAMDEAEEAARALDRGKFPVDQISIITKDISSEKKVQAT